MENTLGLQIEITKELNEMLMRTCDIRFYKELQQPQFWGFGETEKCTRINAKPLDRKSVV